MESEELKTDDRGTAYDGSSVDDTAFPTTGVTIEKENDDSVIDNHEAMSPQVFSPRMKLDPQLLENYYINLARASETNIQEMAQRMHALVNDIVAIFETNRQETLEANLTICRGLVMDIQRMEREQEVMKYQIELYTHKVRQAHEQVFNKNTANK